MTDTQTPGLQRIICIDAHIPGKRMEVKLSAHANISGSNGSGKTTLLKLVPFFYGATPMELVERVGKKSSFTDYYLARPTSLIIYEYMTERGLKCVVVYRHTSGTRPAYRFLDEPFCVEYFSELKDDSPVFIEGRDLGRHWTVLQLGHSKQLDTVIEYRAVIQGDRALITRLAQARELLRLVPMYSLGGAKHSMGHINRMTSAILSRRGNMDGIKQMIADIMREDQIELPQIQLHKNVREIVSELGVLRSLEKNEKLFRKAVDLGTSYLENSQQLKESAIELQTHKVKEGERGKYLGGEAENNRHQLKARVATWDEDGGKIRTTYKDAEHTRDRAEKDRDHLDDAHQKWLDQDIHKKLNDFSSIEDFEHALFEAESHQKALEEGVQDLKQHYEKLERNEIDRHHKKDARLRSVAAEKTQAINDETVRWLEQKSEIESQKNQAVLAHRERREGDVNQAHDELQEARFSAKNILPTDEEKLEESAAESLRDLLEQKRDDAKQTSEGIRGAVKQEKGREDAARQFRKKAENKVHEETLALERLKALLSPKPGSFLAELREYDESWYHSVGKVIREDLLDRRDLSPEFCEDGKDSLFGWTLKLDGLDKPDWAASLEEFELRRTQQEERLDLAEQHRDLKISEHETVLKALKKKQSEHEESLRVVDQYHRKYESAKEAVFTVRAKIKEVTNERRTAAKQRVAGLEKSFEQLKKQVEKELNEIVERFESDMKSAHDQYLVQLSELQEAKELAEREVQDELSNHKAHLDALDKEYKDQCAEQGLDEVVLNAAIQRVKRAKQKYETVKAYKDLVFEYQYWHENEWPRRSEYEATRVEQGKIAEEWNQKYQEAERLFQKDRDKLNRAYSELRNEQGKAEDNRDKCENMLKRAEYSGLNDTVDQPRPIESVLVDVESLLQAQQAILKEVRSSVAKVESVISGQGDRSQITEAWEQLRKEAEAVTSDIGNVDALSINLTRSIDQLLTVHLPQKKETIGSFVQTISGQLEDFYIGLKEISKLIQQQSRAISASISEKQYFEAIGDIDVSLSSRIDNQDYWPYLEDFAELYSEWRDEEGIALPPEKLGELLITVTDILHRSKVETGIESVFDLAITIEENDRKMTATNGRDLEGASSNGLSYLILCSIYAGITRMLCRNWDIRIHWPVDELGVIDSVNVAGLFSMLNDHNIVMVGGFPTTDPLLLQHFKERHEMRKGLGLVDIELPQDKLQALMQSRRHEQDPSGVADV